MKKMLFVFSIVFIVFNALGYYLDVNYINLTAPVYWVYGFILGEFLAVMTD